MSRVEGGQGSDHLLVNQPVGALAVGGHRHTPERAVLVAQFRQAGGHVAEFHLGQDVLVIDSLLALDEIRRQLDGSGPGLLIHCGLYCGQARGLGSGALRR